MAKMRIDVHEHGVPSASIAVPLWVLKGAAKVLPKIVGKKLMDQIDVDQIVALADSPQASGVILEIEDHKSSERITISVARDETKAA
jgi:hypothetical protein